MSKSTTAELVKAINLLADDQRRLGAMTTAALVIIRALLETEAERERGADDIRITDIRDRSRTLAGSGMADTPYQASQTILVLNRLWTAVLPPETEAGGPRPPAAS